MQFFKGIITAMSIWYDRTPSLLKYMLMKSRRLERLHLGLLDGTIRNDIDASLIFCGTDAENEFRKTRWRLMIKYCGAYLGLEPQLKGEHDRAIRIMEVYKAKPVAKLLLKLGFWQAAEELASYAIKRALKLEETATTIELYEILKYAAYMRTDTEQYEYYAGERDFYLRCLEAEYAAYDRWQQIAMKHANTQEIKPELREKIEQYWQQTYDSTIIYKTHRLAIALFRLESQRSIYRNTAKEVLEACSRLNNYYSQNHTLATKIIWGEIHVTRGLALLIMGKNKEGLQEAQDSLECFRPKTTNWLQALEVAFVCSTHVNDFTFAAECYRRANEQVSATPGPLAARWRLYGAYLHFVARYGEIPNMGDTELPDIETLTIDELHDKRGYHVAARLLRIADLIAQSYGMEKADKALDMLDNLRRFLHRHEMQGNNEREECMYKLLNDMAARSFTTEYKSALKGFNALPTRYSYANTDRIEIVPYNAIADILNAYLQKHLRKAA